jgi:hypothetical protein
MNPEKLINLHAEAWKKIRKEKSVSFPSEQNVLPVPNTQPEQEVTMADVWAWIVKNLG